MNDSNSQNLSDSANQLTDAEKRCQEFEKWLEENNDSESTLFTSDMLDDIFGTDIDAEPEESEADIQKEKEREFFYSMNIHTDGFGWYVLTQFPMEYNYPMSEETLDKLWAAYKTEHEDYLTIVPIELRKLNRSEKFFTDYPYLYHVFDYWKDKLLLDEYYNLLSPEKLISWEEYESIHCDMFYEMMDAECGTIDDILENYDLSITDVQKTFDFLEAIMRIVSPFMLLMTRYAYYQTWLRNTIYNDDFRRNRATASYVIDEGKEGLRLSELHDINTNGVPAIRIYKNFAKLYAQSIKGYIETTPMAIEENSIDIQTYIAMANLEVTRLGSDEAFLRKHCQPFFVDSLIEWHRGFFAYIIQKIHQFKGFENFQIPGCRVIDVQKKPNIVNENQILTQLGMSCRRTVAAKIQACKTDADYGKLLYQLQYKWKYFTTTQSRTDYYLAMQQIGKVQFGSSGDFSNCNKGYKQALKMASK